MFCFLSRRVGAWYFSVPLFVVFIGATPLAWGQVAGPNPTAASAASAPSVAAVAAVEVDVAPWKRVSVQPEREASASVQARNVSRLATEVSASVLRWTADVGATVRAGQVLVQLDARDYELAVQRAQAALDAALTRKALAQAQWQRSTDLVAQGFFSQEALSQRESELALAHTEVRSNQAQLATARRQLSKTTLRAPFAGTVIERLAQVGEAVQAGTVLMVLSENRAVELEAVLNPADVLGLRQAQAVFETAGRRYPVRLLRVGEVLSAPARTQSARLGFDPSLKETPPAGSSGTLRWRDTQAHWPASLLVRRGAELGVFVQEGPAISAVARFVPLPGAQEGRAVPVPAALKASMGERALLVVRGQESLQANAAIKPMALPR